MRNDPDFILPEVKSSYQFNTMTNSREFSKQNSPKNEDKHNLIQLKEAPKMKFEGSYETSQWQMK